MNTLAQGFALEELQVEPLTGTVSGPGGREKLDPKVMDVLVQMAEHAGHVVLREELMTRLWPQVIVTDDAITRCFYELRRTLSHAGGNERYRHLLETVPKRGYRLNAAVRPLPAAAGSAPVPAPEPDRTDDGSRRLAVASVAGLVVIAVLVWLWRSPEQAQTAAAAEAPHSVAVLPFLDMSAEKDQGYFSDGVTEEILNRLSQADNLRVISRTSSFALRNETLDVPQIAARLNVSYLLEGSVRKAGGRVRITAQLIDAATNSHVWSRTYDRSVDDLFAVEDEIAGSVATALQVTLAGDRMRQRTPANVEAYEKFLQGQFFYHRRLPGDIGRATDYYRQAIRLDPDYATAWAALAGAYSLQIGEMDELAAKPTRQLQGAAARRAVELDPELAVAQARLAQYYYHVQQPAQGDEHLRRAVTLNPDEPLVLGFSASDAVWRGDYAEAVSLWRKVVAQDPLSPSSRGNLAFMLLANGQLEEALAENRRALELSPDAGPKLEVEIARILILMGRYEEAMAAIDRLPAGHFRDYATALLHRAPGQQEESQAALERLAAAPRDIPGQVRLAEAYAYRGREDDAFDSLVVFNRKLMRERDLRPRTWWYFQDEIRLAPLLRPLHDDPRWAALTAMPG
jgi:TolB-like protein/DNA-binding winged helix-turn-helix (wHTH) protein/Tfp pilus assembly protein PilF